MNRREVLVATAAVVGTGCLGNGGADNGSTAEPTDGAATTAETTETDATDTAEPTTVATETTTTTTEPTATATESEATGITTETRTETPAGTTTGGTTTNGTTMNGTTNGSAADRSFTVRETGGEPGNEASVTVENGGSRIVVTGTITGENGCQTATLESVQNDGSEVRLVIGTERAADAGAVCSQALVGISYRATVATESQPASVTVIHRGAGGEETVATAEPGG